MIIRDVEVAETYRTVTRPAVLDAVKEVLSFYGVKKELQIYYNGETEMAIPYGYELDAPTRSNEKTDTINRTKLFVTSETEITDFNNGYGNSGRTLTNVPFWYSKDLNTIISPIYSGRKIKVEATFHTQNRQDAYNVRNTFQLRLDRQTARPTFNANIHYPVNFEILAILHNLWETNVDNGGVGLIEGKSKAFSFVKYFRAKSLCATDVITNHNNNHPTFVFLRSLANNTLIMEDPTVMLTKPTGKYLGQYEFTFSFSFYLQELTHMRMEYPFLIRQKQIDNKYLPKETRKRYRDRNLYQSVERTQGMFILGGDYIYSKEPVIIPSFDNWSPGDGSEGLEVAYQTALSLEDKDEQIICNLSEIYNGGLDPDIKSFLLRYRERITIRNDSILHIKIYSDDIQIKEEQITLRSNGDIVLLRKPNMGKLYRLVLFINKNLDLLSERAKMDIINDPVYQITIFKKVFDFWEWKGKNISDIIKDNNIITTDEIKKDGNVDLNNNPIIDENGYPHYEDVINPNLDENDYNHLNDKVINSDKELTDDFYNNGYSGYKTSSVMHQASIFLIVGE